MDILLIKSSENIYARRDCLEHSHLTGLRLNVPKIALFHIQGFALSSCSLEPETKLPLCGFSSLLIKKDPLTESLLFTREGIRTPDLLVRSQTLYPTELLALIMSVCRICSATSSMLTKKDLFSSFFIKKFFSAISLIYQFSSMLLSFSRRRLAMEKLTNREITILKLIMQGYANSQISDEVFISIHTVKAHVGSIMKKLNAKNRTNAVYIAIKNNLLD